MRESIYLVSSAGRVGAMLHRCAIRKIQPVVQQKYLINFAPRFPHNRADGISHRGATFYTPQGTI